MGAKIAAGTFVFWVSGGIMYGLGWDINLVTVIAFVLTALAIVFA